MGDASEEPIDSDGEETELAEKRKTNSKYWLYLYIYKQINQPNKIFAHKQANQIQLRTNWAPSK